MSALDSVNAIVGHVFDQYGEDARYVNKSGEVRQITVIRFDPFNRQDMEGIGIATTDPSLFVQLSELSSPQSGDSVTADNETFRVRDVEMHNRRGYARLHLYSER